MKKSQQIRKERLMPNGVPRWIRCYDDGESGDRYTVVYTGRYNNIGNFSHYYVGMSGSPYNPQGFCQHGEKENQCIDVNKWGFAPTFGRKCHLGKRIKFSDLPADCQKVVLDDYIELWDLT